MATTEPATGTGAVATDEAVTLLYREGYPRADIEAFLGELVEAGNDHDEPRWTVDHLEAIRCHMDTIPGFERVTCACCVCGHGWDGLTHQLGDADVIPGPAGRAYCDGCADTGDVAADLRAAAAWFLRAADLLDDGDHDGAWRTADLGRFGVTGVVGRIRGLGG